MYHSIILLLLVILLTGCVTASYQPPYVIEQDKSAYTLIVNKPYDETWDSLVQYAGQTFFGIDNFEKASGLMTLSFGASNPSEFISCGHVEIDATNPTTLQRYKYDGPYVDWLIQQFGVDFKGAMNIVVAETDKEHTRVSINARYVLNSHPLTWVFSTGGADTVAVRNPLRGTGNTRTCMPTYKAEKAVIQGIRKMVTD